MTNIQITGKKVLYCLILNVWQTLWYLHWSINFDKNILLNSDSWQTLQLITNYGKKLLCFNLKPYRHLLNKYMSYGKNLCVMSCKHSSLHKKLCKKVLNVYVIMFCNTLAYCVKEWIIANNYNVHLNIFDQHSSLLHKRMSYSK